MGCRRENRRKSSPQTQARLIVPFTAPHALTEQHDCSAFDCAEPSLNDWLRRKALANQISGASRTFVVTDKDIDAQRVLGYYALAAGAVAHAMTPGAIRRNMPDPIPVMVLGRLATDISCRGQGLGSALLKDAILRTLKVAEEVGIRALLVHALNDSARQFYLHHGFSESSLNASTLLPRLPFKGMREM
jgi:GNAT superfamily N-acetyltransferase